MDRHAGHRISPEDVFDAKHIIVVWYVWHYCDEHLLPASLTPRVLIKMISVQLGQLRSFGWIECPYFHMVTSCS